MNGPVLTIVAGSNGCGKSTLTASARNIFQVAPVLDPDAIAKSLHEGVSSDISDIEAGRRVLQLADELLEKRQSFAVETTLSGSTYLKMAVTAKKFGYSLMVIFIGTSSVEINIERIRARVKKGGHDVSEEDQRRRYPRTLANIKRLLPLADLVVILDNSDERGHQLLGFGDGSSMHWKEPIPQWAANLQRET